MDEKQIFTDEERTQIFTLLKQLCSQLGSSLHEGDEEKIRGELQKWMNSDCIQRDVFGLNPILQSLHTALIAVEEEGLKRDGALAILLYNSVINGLNDLSLIQAGCAFSHDVPPYVIAGGNPMEYGGPNTTIMDIAKVDKKIQKHIANAYRLLFHGKTSVEDVIMQIKEQVPDSPEIRNIVQFLESTKRGIMCK